ncbi:MAG TPA: hypothetical protein V6D20_23135, partial [Candidatus Obscuribacterales bacterium]
KEPSSGYSSITPASNPMVAGFHSFMWESSPRCFRKFGGDDTNNDVWEFCEHPHWQSLPYALIHF